MDWTQDLVALAQVVLIDVALAGDNAVVVGLAVAGLPARQKRPAILLGIGGATVIRIAMGAVALKLLAIIGLLLAGGVLLLWVCWKMFRELRRSHRAHGGGDRQRKTLRQAMVQIILADVSMSLDNVLAVAGAAHDRLWVLVDRPAVVGRADGSCRRIDCPAAGAVPLDRVGRLADRAVCRAHHDLAWRARGRWRDVASVRCNRCDVVGAMKFRAVRLPRRYRSCGANCRPPLVHSALRPRSRPSGVISRSHISP